MTTEVQWQAPWSLTQDQQEQFEELHGLLDEIDYRRDGQWQIQLLMDPDENHRMRIRVGQFRTDTITGEMGWGYGGWYRVSEFATHSEIIQAVFGLFRAYEEHESREAFHWKDKRIFGPHMSIHALHSIADQTDARSPQ